MNNKQGRGIHPGELQGLESKFRDFLKDVSLKHKLEKSHAILGRAYGTNHTTPQWKQESYFDLITAVKNLCPFVSKKEITKAVECLMVRMLDEQVERDRKIFDSEVESIVDVLDLSNVQQTLQEMILYLQDLEKPQIVFVPIEGLTLDVRALEIGNVILYARNRENELDKALEDLEARGRDISYPKESLENSTCYARVKVTGDNYFAREEATRHTEEALHILNLYLSSSLHQIHYWAALRIASVIINRTQSNDNISINLSYPVERPLTVSQNEKRSMNQQGLEIVGNHFNPQNDSDIAKRVRQAVIWYSKAVDTDSLEEKYVNLAIALETLLIGKEGDSQYTNTGSISQKIGERVAFLLGKDFEDRVDHEKTAKRLYGCRSAIVHRGKTVKEDEVAEMDRLVKKVILVFAEHRFNAWGEFLEWIAQNRYGN